MTTSAKFIDLQVVGPILIETSIEIKALGKKRFCHSALLNNMQKQRKSEGQRVKETEIERQINRVIDRQTGRHTDRQIDRQIYNEMKIV